MSACDILVKERDKHIVMMRCHYAQMNELSNPTVSEICLRIDMVNYLYYSFMENIWKLEECDNYQFIQNVEIHMKLDELHTEIISQLQSMLPNSNHPHNNFICPTRNNSIKHICTAHSKKEDDNQFFLRAERLHSQCKNNQDANSSASPSNEGKTESFEKHSVISKSQLNVVKSEKSDNECLADTKCVLYCNHGNQGVNAAMHKQQALQEVKSCAHPKMFRAYDCPKQLKCIGALFVACAINGWLNRMHTKWKNYVVICLEIDSHYRAWKHEQLITPIHIHITISMNGNDTQMNITIAYNQRDDMDKRICSLLIDDWDMAQVFSFFVADFVKS